MVNRKFQVGAFCDIGNVKKTNQDSILVKIGERNDGEFGMFLVADGVGGLSNGDLASEMLVSHFKNWWDEKLGLILKKGADINVFDNEMTVQLYEINKKIFYFSEKIREKVGSTISLLFIYGKQYLIKHIGDSRVYLLDSSIRQLTEDHTWVAMQIAEGKLTKEEARYHPKRNMLTKCIGIKECIDISTYIGSIDSNTVFVVCSDGFYNLLTETEILNEIIDCKKKSKSEALEIDIALNNLFCKVKQRGAYDNASAIIIMQIDSKARNNILWKLGRVFRIDK